MNVITLKTHSVFKLLSACLLMMLFAVQVCAAGNEREQASHDEHEEHGEEGYIALTQAQIAHAGISLTSATGGTIREVLAVYGVVAANAERVQSVHARYRGIVRDLNKSLGDTVHKGETLVAVEADESLKTYAITSALNGVITQRNANVGEQTGDAPLLVVQDFSTLWVELSIFPKDLGDIKLGQSVRIISLDSKQTADGKIIYIAQQSSGVNQAITARVLIDNLGGEWKPGIFVKAQITRAEIAAPVILRNEAIQIIDNAPVIFVQGEEGFEPRLVTLGRSDGEVSEALSGLSIDEVYVSKNSFVLKSELGKEDAEHGH